MQPSHQVDRLAEDLAEKATVDDGIDRPDTKLVTRVVGFRDATADAQVLEQGDDDPLRSAVTSFTDLNLHENILKGVYAMKFDRPSKIQGLAIPAILKRPASNFIGQAQSGTGKTGAFCLSMLGSIDESKHWPQAIVLSPTRELCRQTFDVMSKLSRFTTIKPLLVVPDAEIPDSITNHILVCTPGKLEGLIKRKKVDTKKIVMFVLDEADEMLGQPGQENTSLLIHKKLPKTCQMCLFSATYNDRVSRFAHELVPKPRTSILIEAEKLSLQKLEQFYINCETEQNKFGCLDRIYRSLSVAQTIIFVETRVTAAALAKQMTEAGHSVAVLYGGDMKEKERDRVMDRFRSGTDRTLITTNVLARGVDVFQVSLVINYDLPLCHRNPTEPEYETYLHRIGRSARFGASGIAINFVHDKKTFDAVKKIERHFAREIKELKPAELPQLAARIEERN